uniref:Synaptophysin-like 2b n=1 Tax=Sinocyclocheilus grahami TaxID=75366 RepID=A0A672PJ42_SINGR
KPLYCKVNTTMFKLKQLTGDYSSSAEFFVAIGVLAFLYSTATLVLYLGYQHIYRESPRGPNIVSVVLYVFSEFLRYVCACLTDVKISTSPNTLVYITEVCKQTGNKCTAGHIPSMGRLNSSVETAGSFTRIRHYTSQPISKREQDRQN